MGDQLFDGWVGEIKYAEENSHLVRESFIKQGCCRAAHTWLFTIIWQPGLLGDFSPSYLPQVLKSVTGLG